MVHTLRLDNYSPTPRKLVLGTNSSFGTESIKIERGAGWDGLNLTATWHIPGREEPLRVALLDGDAMDVPPEVTKEAKDGVLVLAGLASGVQRASCNVEYLILEQAGVYGGADAEPTPELAAQVLEATMQAKANAEAAAQDASESKANANKAQQAAENAAADAAKAGPYAEAALNAQKAAEAARDTAISAGAYAENAENAAAGAMTAAAESASKAAASEKAAAAIAIAAAGSATQAEAQKTAAAKAASDAQGYMQAASSAATAANASAENAAGSKAAAASSATASANSATAAAASATTASAKATEAADSASAAAASEQAAAQAAEIAQDAAESLQPEVDQIKGELANKVPKSDYAPEAKTDAMTQPVGKDADGKLWTAPGSGGGGIAVSGATVGQTIKIAAVDDDGVPTAWEPVDLPSGGGKEWELIANGVIDDEAVALHITKDNAGNPFELKRWFLRMKISPISVNTDNAAYYLSAFMYDDKYSLKSCQNNVQSNYDNTRYYQCFGEPIPGAGLIFAQSLSNQAYNHALNLGNMSYYYTKIDSYCFGLAIGYGVNFYKYSLGAGSEYYLYGVRA